MIPASHYQRPYVQTHCQSNNLGSEHANCYFECLTISQYMMP